MFWVCLKAIRNDLSDAFLHHHFKLIKPHFNLTVILVRVNLLDQIYLFSLFTYNANDLTVLMLKIFLNICLCNRGKLDPIDALEALFQMLLNTLWLLRLAKNFDEIFVREEVEARKVPALGSQVLTQILLNVFKLFV